MVKPVVACGKDGKRFDGGATKEIDYARLTFERRVFSWLYPPKFAHTLRIREI